MTKSLLELVETRFVPTVADMGFHICDSEASTSFGDALVVLQAENLLVRIVRERSVLFAEFASKAEPATWFDSAFVMEYMELSQDAGFHSSDSSAVLSDLGQFLRTFWSAFPDEVRLSALCRHPSAARPRTGAECKSPIWS